MPNMPSTCIRAEWNSVFEHFSNGCYLGVRCQLIPISVARHRATMLKATDRDTPSATSPAAHAQSSHHAESGSWAPLGRDASYSSRRLVRPAQPPRRTCKRNQQC